MLRASISLLCLVWPLTQAAYQPGKPGADWTEEQAGIIKAKLIRLWDKRYGFKLVKDFDLGTPGATSSGYMYDPDLTTVVPPYDECNDKEKCDQMMSKRLETLQFTAKKALRLAFHDCIPYLGGQREGGCDGCLNLEKNRKGNMGLQASVAVLERLYRDVDFPPKKGAWKNKPNLAMSPFELGMSRADLWAFAGLVALDVIQEETKELCASNPEVAMCGEPGPCFTPFTPPPTFLTGRADCRASSSAGPLQQYLASREEDHPDDNGNGAMTIDFYNRTFGMTGREGLVLMGAHTVGKFNSMWSRNAYGWMGAGVQMNLFNNKFYKQLAMRPAKVHNTCTGTMADQPAPAEWIAIANIHTDNWKPKKPYATPQAAGHIRWGLSYNRGPDCLNPDPRAGDLKNTWWSRKDNFERCCAEKNAGCAEKASCDEQCTRLKNDKERAIGPDVGYYLKWQVDEQGLPYGCDAFNNSSGSRLTDAEFSQAGSLAGRGPAGCPRQDAMDDGAGQEMWRTVEDFADHQVVWLEEFGKAFVKMQSNGYTEGTLSLGPGSFWANE